MKRKFLFNKIWFFDSFHPTESRQKIWGFQIEKVIFSGKSKFQKIEIFQTKDYGKVLVLDGFLQLSTQDEFVYHEMLVHPALFYHQNPKRVLIVGGGDGGALREVTKHPVKEIFLCDIDKKVIEVSKKYLPSVSKGAFKDKRLKIFNEDALKFLERYKNYFDIIIFDPTDPYGPSDPLWSKKCYQKVFFALEEKGVASFQTAYFSDRFAKKARKELKKVFPYFKIHWAYVRCFPLDISTFSFCSKRVDFDKFSQRKIKDKFKKLKIKTKYYSPQIHFNSQWVPKISLK